MKQLLSSGASLDVTVADIKTGYRLFTAIVRAFKLHGIELTIRKEFNLKQLLEDNQGELINGFLDIITSEAVHTVLLECGQRAVYFAKDGKTAKVSDDLFENLDYRADYFEVLKVIAIENLRPFFPQALSGF